MSRPLDLDAIRRRDAWCAERVGTGEVYRAVGRPDEDRDARHLRSATGSELDAILDRRDLIAEVERLKSELMTARRSAIDEAISVCELNMPYDSMGMSATIRILFRRFVGELRKLKIAGSVEGYIEHPAAGNYE